MFQVLHYAKLIVAHAPTAWTAVMYISTIWSMMHTHMPNHTHAYTRTHTHVHTHKVHFFCTPCPCPYTSTRRCWVHLEGRDLSTYTYVCPLGYFPTLPHPTSPHPTASCIVASLTSLFLPRSLRTFCSQLAPTPYYMKPQLCPPSPLQVFSKCNTVCDVLTTAVSSIQDNLS